jgi:hypothetical protein
MPKVLSRSMPSLFIVPYSSTFPDCLAGRPQGQAAMLITINATVLEG